MTAVAPVMSITGCLQGMAQKRATPDTLVQSCLSRIASGNAELHAYVSLSPDDVRAQARRASRRLACGKPLRPLEGIPIAVKDVIDVKGHATRAHSHTTDPATVSRDAAAVARLRKAGAIVLGKTATWEYSIGETGATGLFPRARNPHCLDRDTGGSSSGSAVAVAAGMCVAALGTDTGGSVRAPAAWCGVVGFKPTRGLVPLDGVLPLGPSVDTLGWITRSAEDARHLLAVLAGPLAARTGPRLLVSPGDTRPLAGVVVGLWRDAHETASPADADVRDAFAHAVDRFLQLGARIRELQLPPLAFYNAASVVIARAESFHVHAPLLRAPGMRALLGDAARERLLMGGLFTRDELHKAERLRRWLIGATQALTSEIDVIAMPTMPTAAPPCAGAGAVMQAATPQYVRFASCTGQPSVSLPCGTTSSGLPIGLMLNGHAHQDHRLLDIAQAWESGNPLRSRTCAAAVEAMGTVGAATC